MYLFWRCPHCGRQFQSPQQWAGKVIVCPSCSASVTLPLAGSSSGQAAVVGPLLRRRTRIQPVLWMLGGFGATSLLFVLLFALVFGSGRKTGPAPANVPVARGESTPAEGMGKGAGGAGPSEHPRFAPQSLDTLPAPRRPPVPAPGASASDATQLPWSGQGAKPAPGSPARAVDWQQAELPPPRPSVPAAGDLPSADWERGGQVMVEESKGLTFGPPGCPVVVSANQVWDLAAKKVRAELEGDYEPRGLTALSPDGSLFAATDRTPNLEDTRVTVWDTQTGKQRFTVPGHPGRYVDILRLSNDKLFLGGRHSGELELWDAASGNRIKSVKLPSQRLERSKTALALDGRYLAMVANDRLVVCSTASGKVVATMSPPGPMDDGPELWAERRRAGGPAVRRADATEAVFVYAWVQSMEFSPDGRELAAVSTHPRPRILCWNSRGALVCDQPIYTASRGFWENRLQWFPNRQAWLIEGDVVDRESGRVVLVIRPRPRQDLKFYVYDDDHLVGTFPHNPGQLGVLPVPWKDIRASLAAWKGGQPALLSPSEPVGIVVELGALRGDQNATLQTLHDSLVKRLARDGLQVQPNRPTYFRLKFAESAGERLPIYERQSPFDFRGRDTGRTVTEAKGSLVVELIVPNQPEPLWRDTLQAASSRTFREDINDLSVRKSMLENIAHQISEMEFPYFIPQSKELLALPVVIR